MTSQVGNIFTSVASAIADPNVQAFLTLIRTGEGTLGPNGYSTLFGGGTFNSFADHPNIRVTRGSLTSTAAGAYQILYGTWLEMQAAYGLTDFSPASQDIAAVGLIKRRGALADVIAGRFDAAITKCNKEWASLPGSPYGQPTLTLARAHDVLASAGGVQIDGVYA
ncbi:glycoside hydrolase family 104 protein [Pandoraea sp. SD6-2]|uniref:glycoside hydrolase family 24 protein n=1 Tax=Pandoraea sp. SD6-2 TaxID=1286093 RepID=UPI0009DB7B35|nr:glycoside hydrolase family 104 protein [Pandoraea sp. SD6-2]